MGGELVNILDQLKENVIVAVIRKASPENIVEIAEALYKGGVKSLEITAETPKAATLIEMVSDRFKDELLIGAGTVLDPETARACIMAGAQFIVSPTVNAETIAMTKRYGITSIPGALTPTEILTAYESGADMVKVFPANAFGPGYVKNIHGPFPYIPLMVTGGINLDNMLEYIDGGSSAIGLGSNLVNPEKLKTEEDFKALTENASNYMKLIKYQKSFS
jgi:2-dehydro-3-deoxyphosphogluconate aldolase / (4S)-4-hydroxy-2-oxoglutarate aldolase